MSGPPRRALARIVATVGALVIVGLILWPLLPYLIAWFLLFSGALTPK